jgi:hypothetical protein
MHSDLAGWGPYPGGLAKLVTGLPKHELISKHFVSSQSTYSELPMYEEVLLAEFD